MAAQYDNEVSETKPKVILVGSSNYTVWSSKIRTTLRGKGLWKYVESSAMFVGEPRDGSGAGSKVKTASKKKSTDGDDFMEPGDGVSEEDHWKKTAQALSVIQNSIHNDIYYVIEQLDTAHEAWAVLRKRFYRTDTQSRVSNETAMHAITHRDDIDVNETIKLFKQLLTKGRQCGEDINDEKAALILLGLVQKAGTWRAHVSTLTTLIDGGNIGEHDNVYDFVESSLTAEQLRRVADGSFKGTGSNASPVNANVSNGAATSNPTAALLVSMVETMQALVASNNASHGGRRRINTAKFTGTCFHCGKIGHRKSECRKLKAELASGGNDAEESANIATGAGGNDGGPSLSAAMAAFLASQSNSNID
jgi:hypothetical protein